METDGATDHRSHPTVGHTANGARPTIRDVARSAGVAISSVSRVLSNHPHVSEELRTRVETAARDLGYRPNHIAHSLRRGNTLSVGFLVGTISNPIIADISAAASNVLAVEGYATLLVCSQNDPDAELDYLTFLAQRRVSGLIISSAARGPGDRLRELIVELGIPTVMLDRRGVDAPHVSAVRSDHAAGIRAATQRLLDQGHHRIAYIGGPAFFDLAAARLEGYLAALQASGHTPDPALIYTGAMTLAAGYEAVHALFAATPPTAIVAGGNLILMGILQALKELGVGIGRDVALVGSDDTDLSRLYHPSISVIVRDLAQLGQVAATTLIGLINGDEGHTIVLPTRFEERDSSRCAPAHPAA